MDREQLDKRLDEWLDRASARFGRAEPRPGFEARVVAGLHDRIARRGFLFRYALALAATIAAFFVVWAFFARFADHHRNQAQENRVAESTTRLRRNDAGMSRVERPEIPASISRRSKAAVAEHARNLLPRKGVFPSRALSYQDRLLLDYARSISSGEITGYIVGSEYRPIEITRLSISETEISRIDIEPVRIEPLP